MQLQPSAAASSVAELPAVPFVLTFDHWGGILSLSSYAKEAGGTCLQAFCEAKPEARHVGRECEPQALDLGPHSDDMYSRLSCSPHIYFFSFDCSQFAACGKMQMHLDKRSEQVVATIRGLCLLRPLVALGENVPFFSMNDSLHGLFSLMLSTWAAAGYTLYQPWRSVECRLGGAFDRERDFFFVERTDLLLRLPPLQFPALQTVVSPQAADMPAAWLDPDVPDMPAAGSLTAL